MEVVAYWPAAALLHGGAHGTGHQEREEDQEPEGLQEGLQGAHHGDAPCQDVIPQELDYEELDEHNDSNRHKTRQHYTTPTGPTLIIHETLRNSGIDKTVHTLFWSIRRKFLWRVKAQVLCLLDGALRFNELRAFCSHLGIATEEVSECGSQELLR
jgi:hypothetical protein